MLFVSDHSRHVLQRREVSRLAVRKLNRDRRSHMVRLVADILRGAEPTPFAFEATCRHRIRAALCLKGWSWQEADDIGKDIVEAALRQVGAVRPTWKEGQPEYTQEGHVPADRTRCIRCNRPLEGYQRKFCGSLCANAHNMALASVRAAEDAEAYDKLVRGAKFWWKFHETR